MSEVTEVTEVTHRVAKIVRGELARYTGPQATREHAAVVMIGTLMRAGDLAEHGGCIIETAGEFRASVRVTQGLLDRVHFEIAWPIGSRLAAIYHSHAAEPSFSGPDTRLARELGIPSFIGTMRDHRVLQFDPATGATTMLGTLVAATGGFTFQRYQ